MEPKPLQTRRSRAMALGVSFLAILLYLVLVDVAVETFLSDSPVRWIVGAAIAAYLVLSFVLRRRVEWPLRATLSLFILLGLLAITAWLPSGISHGVAFVRQPTSVILAITTAGAILLSGLIPLRMKVIPLAARIALGAAVIYGISAFAYGALAGVTYPELLHGRSVLGGLPFWLQGAFVGALVLIPLALLLQIVYALLRVRRGARLRAWSVELVVLSLALLTAVAGFVASP